MSLRRALVGLVPLMSVLVLVAAPSASSASGSGVTSRVSVDSSGRQSASGGGGSGPGISADGRFVAFSSLAPDLVPGDTNSRFDVFVRDRLAGVTERVSIGAGGQQANNASDVGFHSPAISANGRYVAFDSDASNLVPGDTNGTADVFVRDRLTDVTRRVSVGAAGQGNGQSLSPAISADGQVIAFHSHASNLVPGDTNGTVDVFVHDQATGVTQRVSVGAAGQGNRAGSGDKGSAFPAISANGRLITFRSAASNLVAADTNAQADVFVRDRLAGVTQRVSVGSAGQADGESAVSTPAISADGRFVVFASSASNLVPGDTNATVDVFVRDRLAAVTRRVSVGIAGQGTGVSAAPTISADGRFVAFYSFASNLVAGDTNGKADVFVRDRLAGVTRRMSIGAAGQGNNDSLYPSISANGHSVAFRSDASNLVPGDTNATFDAFVRDPLFGS